MTPFKSRLLKPKRSFFPDDLDDDSDEVMVSSPPRSGAPLPFSLPSANLFGDDSSSITADTKKPASSRRRFPLRSRGGESVLRPIDLNEGPNHASPSKPRKRPTDSHISGREEMFEDSDEDMFLSPRASPTSYRTMDGRTVTSKNPFSPYTPCTMEDDTLTPMQSQQSVNAPQFPYSFTTDRNNTSLHLPTSAIPAPTPAKINLQRRDTQVGGAFRQTYFGPSKTGFPDQSGRYSFTGSPIEELDILDHSVPPALNNKFRRLHREHDQVAKSRVYNHTRTMHVNTEEANYTTKHCDEISPTDVMSFLPPTPTKAARSSFTPHTPERGEIHINSSSMMNKPPKSRFNQDFDVIGQLGNGSFGTVYKCLSRLDGCMYAVKAAKRKAKGNADRDRMLKEVYALAALCDQADTAAFHIVRYHQAWMEENRLYIQTELCSFTLDAEMKRGPLTVPRRYKLLREILVALEFIHRNGMVHLDIKPENIFVKNDQYKLGDFGLVSTTTDNNDVEEGDSRYMSMELLSGDHSDLTKSDIFSLGATMYQICLERDLPMSGQEWQDIRAGVLQSMGDTPFALELIVKSMMHPDAHQRPHPSQLLKKNELLSDEQKQLLREKEKVLEVNMALALQTQRMKKLTPPRPGGLMRANTWNGSLPKWI